MKDCLFASFPTLETPRLLLRSMSADDAADLFAVFSDPLVAEHQDWAQATTFIKERADLFQRRIRMNWGLSLKGGSLIGQVGLHTI